MEVTAQRCSHDQAIRDARPPVCDTRRAGYTAILRTQDERRGEVAQADVQGNALEMGADMEFLYF
jgi:hypothetical protein